MATDQDVAQARAPSIPDILPVLPLRGMVAFPLAVVPLVVGQERSVRLIDEVMRGNRILALAAQKDEAKEEAGVDDIHRVGTAAIIHQLLRGPEGSLRLVIQGLERIRLLDFVSETPFLVARVERIQDQATPGVEIEGLRRATIDVFRRLVQLSDELPNELAEAAEGLADARQVAYLVASTAPLSTPARQELLELDPLESKLRRLVELLQHESAVRELGRKITAETQEQMTKQQRQYFLREQLKSIQRELGEAEETGEAELRRKLDEGQLPESARNEAERELNRLASIPPASPEHGIIRTYLEWLATLPWGVSSATPIDVPRARQILDEDHYDIEKVKARILEYLAVRKLRQERLAARGESEPNDEPREDRTAAEPILCFVGPPGVGKTSLGQSIARALGRKFVRASLGGMHDEAEIRGHRRTYIGAMPGQVIQAIKRARTRDPVFMLDEVDKVGADWRGDPSSALLEVLDPAQNHNFMDNYLGVPWDLSPVLFITTANTVDSIQPALRDRMEILELSGYTDDEKVHIARGYLIPKQLKAHVLSPEELSFDDEAIRRIVRGYTREAGVRNLDRQIGTVCRKVARDIAEGKKEPERVTADNLAGYLGRERFFEEVAERTDRPGVATGLAWTPTGGDVLFVEATLVPGREEELILTGMLGDVMRESAQAALSYVRSNADRFQIDPAVFDGKKVHVHVPAGAIPKDGPSAGVTMAIALASVAGGLPVHGDVAMTGEVTLRGKVLPVGGIKEKVLAAHRAGIRTVVIPSRNERDLEDVPEELRREMQIVLADTVDDVIGRVLDKRTATDEAREPVAARTGE